MPQISGAAGDGQTIHILSIDGGGIRGLLPARILQEIEQRTKKPASSLFHLISGTSTGGIISCGLATEMPAKDLADIYAKRGGEIFSRSLWQRISNPMQTLGPKYRPNVLESILAEVLKHRSLRDITKTEVLIPAYAIELSKPQIAYGVASRRAPMFFKSWKARGVQLGPDEKEDDFNFELKDVARATSAAPTFFPPARIQNSIGNYFSTIDGGVFANNPSLCALVAAHKLYPGAKYHLVSLGTGTFERDIPHAKAISWGQLQWLHPILSVLMDGNADTVCYQCDQVLGNDHERYETTLGLDPKVPTAVNEDFDDASPDNIARLERLAEKMISDSDQRLGALCKQLCGGSL